MRVIGGRFKNRLLKMPRGAHVRTTANLVKKGIFDVLNKDEICGTRVLDLFAGSGAFGLEALSYQAGRVVFVERRLNCIKIIKDNIAKLGRDLPAGVQVIKRDVFSVIKYYCNRGEIFDLVFLDPPYDKNLAKKCLIYLDEYAILHHHGIIVAEHHKKEDLPQALNNIVLFKRKVYGDTAVDFYKCI
ncbi:MAG: 16S rRNA (guanine(966)-N(2))-methyltransferase RsmD [Candidatus Omnitrophota bacterium]